MASRALTLAAVTVVVVLGLAVSGTEGQRAIFHAFRVPSGDPYPTVHNFTVTDSLVLNTKQIKMFNVWYDGQGPAARWVLTNSSKVLLERPKFTRDEFVIIPDDQGTCSNVRPYFGEDLVLTLPADHDFVGTQYLSLYCLAFDHNFGYIEMPANLRVSEFIGLSEAPDCSNSFVNYFTIGLAVGGAILGLILIIAGIIVYLKCIRKK